MRRGGDLVLERDSRVLWGTGTHVAGSHASLLTSGNLVVYGPGGRVLWQSHTSAHDAFIELNCGYVSMSARSGNPAWHEPAGPQPAC